NGWNLLSVPFMNGDMRKTTLYSGAITNAFIYGPTGYVAKDTLRNGVAYWVKFPAPQSVEYSGASFAPDTVDVATGWNMVGAVSYPGLTSSIVTIGTTIVTPFYGYGLL